MQENNVSEQDKKTQAETIDFLLDELHFDTIIINKLNKRCAFLYEKLREKQEVTDIPK